MLECKTLLYYGHNDISFCSGLISTGKKTRSPFTARRPNTIKEKTLESFLCSVSFRCPCNDFLDDAPALEKTLHKAFNDKRLNLVNLRKEFFQVELSKIKTEVLKDYPNAQFVMFPEAEDYRKSVAKRTKVNASNMPANSQGTF